jgi:hypothetical protein
VKLQLGTQSIALSQTGSGQWQGTFPIGALPVGQTSMALALTASRSDGTSATISIPISIAAQ